MTSTKKTVTVTQTGSPIRRQEYQGQCLQALGLGRMNKTRTLEDNAIVRGLITKVRHLLRVEE